MEVYALYMADFVGRFVYPCNCFTLRREMGVEHIDNDDDCDVMSKSDKFYCWRCLRLSFDKNRLYGVDWFVYFLGVDKPIKSIIC